MAAKIENGTVAQLLSDDLSGFIEQIASEVDIKNYEIKFEQQQFTGDNFCGDLSRVQIIPLKDNNGQKALHLIVKKAPLGGISRASMPIHDFYVAEIFVYTDIIPAFYRLNDEFNVSCKNRFLSPTFYKGLNEEFNEILILKDLSDDGFIMRDKRSTFDYDHAALILQNMARLHAASFAMKEKHPEQFTKLSGEIPQTANLGNHMMLMLQNVARSYIHRIVCLENRTKMDSFVGKMNEMFHEKLDASLSEPYNVICHGDSWNNNMLFKYNKDNKVEQVVFIDWQIVRLASPLIDLSYMFCISTNQHMLESHLDHLLDLYYETLGLRMKDMGCDVERSFPKDVFMEHFRRYMPFGLAIAVGGLPIALGEPEDAKELEEFDYEYGNIATLQVPMSDSTFERIGGLLDYYVKNDLI